MQENEAQSQDNMPDMQKYGYSIWDIILMRKKMIIGTTISFILSVFVASMLMPNIYKGEVTLKINKANLDYPTHATEGLQKDIITARELSDAIGVMNRDKIKNIFSDRADRVWNVKITSLNPYQGLNDKLRLVIEVKDPNDFNNLVNIFLDYLNNIPLLKKFVDNQKEQLYMRSQELEHLIKSSRRDVDNFNKMFVRERLNPIGFDPIDINRKLSDLKMQKILVSQQVKNLSAVEIITAPTVSQRPVKPKPLLYSAIAGVFGLLTGFLLAIWWYRRDQKK
jgi:hypothetical protein